MLAVAWAEARPFTAIHDLVATLEIYGLASFGWGVAWLGDSGKVEVERGLRRFIDEAHDSDLMQTSSTRYLVHLRRPNKLSTVQYADTQPFCREGEFAFCHNGYLDRAEALRPNYADRLAGGADSEVGWCFFQDRIDEGSAPADALREVDETFQGKVNLGYLDSSGTLAVYSDNVANAMWRFNHLGADMVSTGVHSDDESLFTLVVPAAEDRRLVPVGTTVVLGSGDDGQPQTVTQG
jgi:glutamine phosphoribosylpyrophosphate amidotransferase